MGLQAETIAISAARQTFTLTSGALYALLAGAYQGSVLSDETFQNSLAIEIHAQSFGPTTGSLDLVTEDIDIALASELERVTFELASTQVDLDRDSRRVLYTRMRELYLR